jgi:hypothetical protein
VRRVGEILECLDCVGFERAVEDEETGEGERRFDLFTRDGSDLVQEKT